MMYEGHYDQPYNERDFAMNDLSERNEKLKSLLEDVMQEVDNALDSLSEDFGSEQEAVQNMDIAKSALVLAQKLYKKGV